MATATAAPPKPLTAKDLVDLFGPIPLWRIRFDPEPGTATEKDLLDIRRRERRLFELVHGILMEKPLGRGDPAITATKLFKLLGPMPLSRLRFNCNPGCATEKDVIVIHDRENCLCELIDGILVEKIMGAPESFLVGWIITLLNNYCHPRNLGAILGADGMLRLAPGMVRIPDAAFISWDRFPGRKMTEQPIPDLCPDLAVEVLSPSNLTKEMKQKLKEYFAAGCRRVWYVDPKKRIVTVYTSPNSATVLAEDQTLDGGEVLPGFSLSIRQMFAELDAKH